jgi:microcin C transport system permease protein
MPVSVTFGLTGFFLTYLICIPLGIAKARRSGSWFDSLTSGIVFFLYSIPAFALGVLLIVYFGGGSFLNWFPIQGMTSENFSELSL